MAAYPILRELLERMFNKMDVTCFFPVINLLMLLFLLYIPQLEHMFADNKCKQLIIEHGFTDFTAVY